MGKIFGIDLGTTYSCISYVDEYGKAVVVTNEENSPVTPSVVYFEEGGNVTVGEDAKQAMETNPILVCEAVKRMMGNRGYRFEAHGQEYSAETVSSLILKKLAKDAEAKLGEPVTDVVITCPAYFGLDEREATRNAGEIAGLNVLSIINEPTAAAISYGINANSSQTVLVYDLGGGTFDITIIKVASGSIEVIATDGDHELGGKDWDRSIQEYAIQQYTANSGNPASTITSDPMIIGDLKLKSETAKKQLSKRAETMIRLEDEKVVLSKAEFENITRDKLERTISLTKLVMEEAAKKGTTSYDKILLVGGSTKMLQVETILKETFPNITIETCDQDEAVAKGAAIFGINIAAYPMSTGDNESKATIEVDKNNPIFALGSGRGPISVINVISQSIAIEFSDGILNQITKNTAIPCTHTIDAGTVVDNQKSVLIHILQSGSTDTKNYMDPELCKSLVSDDLGPLPVNLPKGAPIQVLLKINSQGLLSIDAKDITGGRTIHLEVQLNDVMTLEEKQEAEEQVKGLQIR